MPTPTYLGSTSAVASSVSFSLPYGTEMLIIIGGRYDGGGASPPTGATYNSISLTSVVSADSSAGSFETGTAMFRLMQASLPAPGSSYTAAITGGVGATYGIIVAAFGGIDQAAPTGTDSGTTAWSTSVNGLINDLMIGAVMSDNVPGAISGGTTLPDATRLKAGYYILTANESPHTISWAGSADARDTYVGAMFASWKGGGPIWL